MQRSCASCPKKNGNNQQSNGPRKMALPVFGSTMQWSEYRPLHCRARATSPPSAMEGMLPGCPKSWPPSCTGEGCFTSDPHRRCVSTLFFLSVGLFLCWLICLFVCLVAGWLVGWFVFLFVVFFLCVFACWSACWLLVSFFLAFFVSLTRSFKFMSKDQKQFRFHISILPSITGNVLRFKKIKS